MDESTIKIITDMSFDKGKKQGYKNVEKLIIECIKRGFKDSEILAQVEDLIDKNI